MTAAKYSDGDLNNLYRIAVTEGVDKLEHGEKIALIRWCKRTNHPVPNMKTTPNTVKPIVKPKEHPAMPATVETTAPATPPATPSEYFTALGFTEVNTSNGKAGFMTEETAEDMILLKAVRFVDDWPDDIETDSPKPETRWTKPAQALVRFSGRIGIIADDLDRRAAMSVRRRINHNTLATFKNAAPTGTWHSEIAPDHHHPGRWIVLAQHQAAKTTGKTRR
ncbi:hypothetical protein [Bifidobacterium biavatii]|uniref:Uncharacterized protein n=1 Tax=Bifidobacterium biavatii DSM 23969 TaxID=1437608 RepID=A0A086ZTT3_9BIFI|nr:hypothetical protein [Bifidobacterium biavatii]KFI49933.1 hypothetical protein BBIA_1855 [Bifidobacterium biavatii DSM 23969]